MKSHAAASMASLLPILAFLSFWATGALGQVPFAQEGSRQLWQIDKYKSAELCELTLSTLNGGNCKVGVYCKDGGLRTYPYAERINGPLRNCYPGGNSSMVDSRIGEFSVTWLMRDGTEGEGLTDPVVYIKNMGHAIRVSPLAMEFYEGHDQCVGRPGRMNCDQSVFVCRLVQASPGVGASHPQMFREKRWSCGIPKDGKNWPYGLSWWKNLVEGSGWKPLHPWEYGQNFPWGPGLKEGVVYNAHDCNYPNICQPPHAQIEYKGLRYD